MIGADLRFEGFDARSWTNLLSLVAPGVVERLEQEPQHTDAPEASRTAGPDRPRGTLLVVHDAEGRVLKALHTMHGRVAGLTEARGDVLQALCQRYGARRGVLLREGVLEEAAERVAIRLQRGDDYLTQLLVLLKVLREFREAGLIQIWPSPKATVPVPSPGTVRRALDLILPDDHAVVIMLWDGGVPWTSIAVRRHAGSIDRVAGPDLLGRWTGALGGDWRRDYRVVAEAVGRRMAPVHLGVFAETATMRALLRDPDPGAWARAVAVRDVILHPAPPYVTVALGADALRAVAASSARLLGGLDVLGALGPMGEYLRSRVSDVASITATLGFNPLRALAEMLRGRDPATDDGAPPEDGEPDIPRSTPSPPPARQIFDNRPSDT